MCVFVIFREWDLEYVHVDINRLLSNMVTILSFITNAIFLMTRKLLRIIQRYSRYKGFCFIQRGYLIK